MNRRIQNLSGNLLATRYGLAVVGSAAVELWRALCILPVVSYSVGDWTFASILISVAVGFLLYLAKIFAYFAVMPLKLRHRLSHGKSGLRLT